MIQITSLIHLIIGNIKWWLKWKKCNFPLDCKVRMKFYNCYAKTLNLVSWRKGSLRGENISSCPLITMVAMIIFPTKVIETNDQFGCYRLLYTWIHKLLPPLQICNNSRIFCQAAAKNVLEVSIHEFHILYYYTNLIYLLYVLFSFFTKCWKNDDHDCTLLVFPNSVNGIHSLHKRCSKLAHLLDYDNPKSINPNTRRVHFVSNIVKKLRIDPKIQLLLTSYWYLKPDVVARDCVREAVQNICDPLPEYYDT